MALFLEDLPVGTRWDTGSFTVTKEDVLDFARKYDPQPMHIDPDAAARGRFGGLIASGWHTAALVMRCINDAQPFEGTEILGIGVDQILWPLPVRPGDTIEVKSDVVANIPSKSQPGFGVVKFRSIGENQHGEVVISVTSNCWVPRK